MSVIDDGTSFQAVNWGMIVDAGDSFDPDKTRLEYTWGQGAEVYRGDNTTGKFESLAGANLTIEDQYNLTASREMNFLDHYSPGIASVTELTDGPYYPNQTVRFRITSGDFTLTKDTYYDQLSIGTTVSGGEGRVSGWGQRDVDWTNSSRGGPDISDQRARYYSGVVEVSASAFTGGEQPTISIYNTGNVQRTRSRTELPDVSVVAGTKLRLVDLEVHDLEYEIREPSVDRVRTTNRKRRDAFRSDGYDLESTTNTGTEYVLERYEMVEPATWDNETRWFATDDYRDLFVEHVEGWQSAGTRVRTVTRNDTEVVWRNTSEGPGTFTGRTRQVTSGSVTETEYQYSYTENVSRVGQREVSATKTIEIQVNRTHAVERCNFHGVCRMVDEQYSTTETREISYLDIETYSYTEEVTRTYWATRPRSSDHTATGESRTVTTDEGTTWTQYQFTVTEAITGPETQYLAVRNRTVSPASYEWQVGRRTTDEMLARSIALVRDDYRIGETVPTKEWTLTKPDGYRTYTASSYDDPTTVQTTSATVEGSVVNRIRNLNTNRVTSEESQPYSVDFDTIGAVTPAEIRRTVRQRFQRGTENCVPTDYAHLTGTGIETCEVQR